MDPEEREVLAEAAAIKEEAALENAETVSEAVAEAIETQAEADAIATETRANAEAAAITVAAAQSVVALAETQAAKANLDAAVTIAENEAKETWQDQAIRELQASQSAMMQTLSTMANSLNQVTSTLEAALTPKPPSEEMGGAMNPEQANQSGSADALPVPAQSPSPRRLRRL